MANGKIHMTVNIITGISLTSFLYFNTEVNLEPVILGSVLGTIITPDYDLRYNLPKSIICKIPVIGEIWKIIWWPYCNILKHRSVISHSFILSTILRMIYISLWIAVPLYLAIGDDIFYINVSKQYLFLLAFTWCLQDTTHLVLDRKWGFK